MHPHAMRPSCLFLSFIFGLSSPAGAQQNSGSTTDSSNAPPAPIVSARRPLHDYVPCTFYDKDVYELRAQDKPPTPPAAQKVLDRSAAEQLWDTTYVALSRSLDQYSSQYNTDFLTKFKEYYKTHLTVVDLIGKTPDEANAHIQMVIADAGSVTNQVNPLLTKDKKAQAAVRAANELQGFVGTAADKFVKEEQTKEERKNVSKALKGQPFSAEKADTLVQATKDYISQDVNRSKFTNEYLTEVLGSYRPDTSLLQHLPPAETAEYLRFAVKQAALSATNYPFPDTSPQEVLKAVTTLQNAAGTSAGQATKGNETQQYKPPDDVSCSMAVMSWRETRDIFGRRVANTFVAVQVTLRNLNTKNEFLVHDIQVAIDTGVSPDYFGRFQAGRDKLLVRAVAQRGQSDDRRNVVLNVLQAAGAIAGASSIATGVVEAKDAVAVFQGPFLTGFANIFPDHTVEQLNHINDLVFSASNTSKVLVPVQGSVPLVTFISEKPLEQLPFAWCGHRAQSHMNPERWVGWGPEQICRFNEDKQALYQAGASAGPAGSPNASDHHPGYPNPYRYDKAGNFDNGGDGEGEKRQDNVRPWSDLHYRNWRAAALRMLQEHTFVVVGGVHIQEVVTQPKLASLDCPLLTGRQVDILQVKDGTVNCPVTGSGLNLVTAITLQKGDSKIAGTIKAAGDGNSATLQFKPEDMCDSEGAYSLFLTYKSDSQKDPAQVDSGDSLSLAKQAVVDSVSLASGKLTITGKCLDQLYDASLVEVGKTPPSPFKDSSPKAGTGNTQADAVFTGLKNGTSYYLTYSNKVQPATQIDLNKSKTVTVTAPAAAKPAG